MSRSLWVALAMSGALLGCTEAPLPGVASGPLTTAAASVPMPDPGEPGLDAPVARTVEALREQKASAFELALLRLEMLDAPRLKATLLDRHVLMPHPQAMGAYTYSETGEIRVRLDDDWQQKLSAHEPFIIVRVDFGSLEQPATPRAVEEARRRAAEAVAYVRTGLTGSNGCEPWEMTADGMSQGKCTYRLIEQRFFPQTRSGYVEPLDPLRMHAIANVARAFRIEATASFRAGTKDTKRVICSGPITADETRCAVHDAAST